MHPGRFPEYPYRHNSAKHQGDRRESEDLPMEVEQYGAQDKRGGQQAEGCRTQTLSVVLAIRDIRNQHAYEQAVCMGVDRLVQMFGEHLRITLPEVVASEPPPDDGNGPIPVPVVTSNQIVFLPF